MWNESKINLGKFYYYPSFITEEYHKKKILLSLTEGFFRNYIINI
jgi:hypothetical protein